MHARYQLDTIIDQGGMGTIYRAYDRLANTWVALKQLSLVLEDPTSPELDNGLRLALAEEFRLLATLRHPHIVSVLDYGFAHNTAFFTMEHLDEAQTLVQAAQGQPLPQKLHLIGQLLQALEYLRRHQVVHRDLKPDNVLVQHGQVKVLDFGLAVFEGQLSTTMGSLFYMAPETFGPQPLTHTTDLFAVGVMAYEILAGQRPFAARTLQELITRIVHDEPDFSLLRGPAALQPVLARLLAKNPSARFASAAEALAALAAAGRVELQLETQATRASYIQAAQFVGRQTELAQLTQALQQAQTGHGSAWLVGGEGGVGKSRLLEELRIRAAVHQVAVWPGQAVSEGSPPAMLWQPILRWLALVAAPSDLEAAVLKPFVPQLETLLGRAVGEAPPLEASAAQARFCATVVALLRQATATQPVVLILEDLHWVGPFSRAVLAWIMRAVSEMRLLVVATYRDDEAPDLPTQLPPAQQLLLQRFEREQVAALAQAIFGLSAGRLVRVVDFLFTQTDGNVFFVVEILRSLAEEAGQLQRVQTMALPEQLWVGGVQQLLQRRLQRIEAADYPWLVLAAAAGRTLDLALLQHLGPDFDWAAWLSRCAETAVLEPQGPAWHFAHDQLRQSLLASRPPAELRALHLTIATALEHVYAADLGPHLGRLAYHYSQTAEHRKQQAYLWQAGQAAQAVFDYVKAVNYYAQLLAEPQAMLPSELYLQYGQALEVLGRWPEAEAAYQKALTQAQGAALSPVLAQSQKALGQLARLQGNYAAALNWLTQALHTATHLQDPQVLGQIQTALGTAHLAHNDYAQAQTHLETGLSLAQAQHDAPTIALALNYLGNLKRRLLQFPQAKALFEASLRLRRTMGDKPGVAMVLTNLGGMYTEQGHHALAQTCLEEALNLRREMGDKYGQATALNNLGYLFSVQGDFAVAQALQIECLALQRELGSKYGIAYALENLGLTMYGQGVDYTVALSFFVDSLVLSHEIGEGRLIPDAMIGVAACYLALGQTTRAVQLAAVTESMRQTLRQGLGPSEQQMYQHILTTAPQTLGPTAYAYAWASGQGLLVAQAVELALAGLALFN